MIILKSYLHAPKVIVGAGGAAWWILQGFTRNSIDVDGFVVTEDYGITETCGYPVFSPNNWYELPNPISEYVAIIGIMNPEIDINLIAANLKDLGWSNVVTFSQFAASLLNESGINCAMLDPKVVLNSDEALEEVRDMLEDSESKECLAHLVSYVQNFSDNIRGIIPHPYFVSNLPRWDSPLRILDCGAFDGGTLKQAVQNGYQIESSICFEPDKSNFAKLVANTPKSEKRLNLPVAVGHETKTSHFSAQSSSGSQVISEGRTVVQCISIDEMLFNWRPNLIKMDIEGSEFSALLGAEATIKKFRPNLAISVYHKASDITQIPLWIKSVLGSDVRYYLRRHSRTVADTVLYVYPDKHNSKMLRQDSSL